MLTVVLTETDSNTKIFIEGHRVDKKLLCIGPEGESATPDFLAIQCATHQLVEVAGGSGYDFIPSPTINYSSKGYIVIIVHGSKGDVRGYLVDDGWDMFITNSEGKTIDAERRNWGTKRK